MGDFVLRRADGVFSYQLAVSVDDAAQAIDLVIRGADLLSSTPRQLYLLAMARAAQIPEYAHLPLVIDSSGQRLAKRTRAQTVRQLRENGVSAAEIVGVLAHAAGLSPDSAPRSLDELASGAMVARAAWTPAPFSVPRDWERSNEANEEPEDRS